MPQARYTGNEDCLHSCLPGPVDQWSRLLFNLVDVMTLRSLPPDSQAEVPLKHVNATGFFHADEDAWLHTRGMQTHLEHGMLETWEDASRQWWWRVYVKNCTERMALDLQRERIETIVARAQLQKAMNGKGRMLVALASGSANDR